MSALDGPRPVRVGAVQAASAFLDRDRTTDRACELIAEAGRAGVEVLGFPEGFIPTHPDWYHYLPASSAKSFDFARRLYNNSVEIPSPTTHRLADAARRARVNVVIGVCERTAPPDLTLYNTQLFISSDGTILGKHQKIMPTLAERVVHARGAGDGLRAFGTRVGRVSGLICGENSNPLAIMALAADRPDIHVASWPSPVSRDEGGMTDLIRVASQSLAYATGAFVISSQAVMSEEIVSELAQNDADRRFLAGQIGIGSALVAAPSRDIVAGPMDGPWEGIVTADIDLQAVVQARHVHDFAGHYNRPDIFSLRVNRGPARLVEPWDGDERLDPAPVALPGESAARDGTDGRQPPERDEARSASG